MKKIQFLSNIFAVLATILSLSEMAHADFANGTKRYALGLAAQRFDSNQTQPMNTTSPEFKWMMSFIKAAATKSPDFKNLIANSYYPVEKQDLLQDPFRTISFSTSGDNDAQSSLFTKYMEEWFTKAGAGCQHSASAKDNTSTESYVLALSDPTCNSSISAGLIKIGINQITLILQEDSRGSLTRASLFLSAPTDSLQLMKPVAQQLSQVPDSEFLAKAFSQESRNPGVSLGESSFQTKMDNGSASASLDSPISLEVKKGWGDCMAGCIYKHYWTIIGTPKRVSDHYEFDVQITESGSPIPTDGSGNN